MNSGKKLTLNTISSLVYEVSAIICGFILPRLILQAFGSSVNGLVNSVSQFLGVINFLEMGVGAVIKSSLYKPLYDGDNRQISRIVASGQKFFRRIALILAVYVVVLAVVLPIIKTDFDFLFTALLVLAMSVSTFAQYYFGIIDGLLLGADQRGYVQYFIQTLTILINTLACAIIINWGASIQTVKLVTSLIFLLRPLVLRLYVKKHYDIDRKIKYQGEPISQKWDGFAQHLSAVILEGTDVIVLTLFATLPDVSVYSVYYLVVKGVKTVILSFTSGIQPLLGRIWAKGDKKQLKDAFTLTEWAMHAVTAFAFSCTAFLIIPFVEVYTSGITDANYVQPLFGYLIVFANAFHRLSLPYQVMIQAAGEYKNTKTIFYVTAVMNIVISVATVFFFGLVGVAIGTLVSMATQTVWLAVFNHKKLVKGAIWSFIRNTLADVVTIVATYFATSWLAMSSVDYAGWITLALPTAGIALAVTVVVNLIFNYRYVAAAVSALKAKKAEKAQRNAEE
ncbi:MAG: sugar isomerase [Clostridia bacterium]|nr:sugar isomerase [Clostridia bacterium]